MSTIPSVQLFRNSRIITGRTAAAAALENQKSFVADGGLILARYSDDGSENGVKTLLGIVRNGGGTNVQLTIIDVEGAAENLQNAINNISREKVSEEGKAITSIRQENGVVFVEFGGVAAANVSVADKGNKFTATNVEDTLSEIKDSLDAAIGVGGTVAEQITNAINGINGTTEITDGKVITAISQTKGIVYVSTATLGADKVSASKIDSSDTTVAVTGTNVSAQIASLATSIKSVSTDAKTYSITSITGDELTALGANVKEAYKLVDEDETQAGDIIKIYKDSSLKEAKLDGQTLKFTYILADETEQTVEVDVSAFLAESEFKNGLEVVDHVVNVKIDGDSEPFLNVGENGVKLSGVQDAINTTTNNKISTLNASIKGESDHVDVTVGQANGVITSVTVANEDIASATLLGAITDTKDNATAFGRIAKEAAAREDAIGALNLTQVGGDGKVITTISQSGGQVSASAIDLTANNVKATASTGVPTAVDVAGETVSEQIASLATSIKSASTAAAAAHTVVNAKPDGHVKVTVSSENSHDVVTITENDIASAAALATETTARQNQDDKIEASIGLDAEGNHVKTNGHYTKDATTVVGEIAALDTQLKVVSDTLGTGVSTAEGKTVTAQLQALSGGTNDTSGATSVKGAKAYAKDLVDNLDAEVESKIKSETEITTTKAIKIVQTNGKIASITLGAFDCGTY